MKLSGIALKAAPPVAAASAAKANWEYTKMGHDPGAGGQRREEADESKFRSPPG